MPHYWFSHWANSRRNVPNQRSAADIIQPWPLLPAWHIEINVLPHKAAYSWASPLGWQINWTIFSLFFTSSLSISQVYKQKPFVRAPCATNVSSFFFLKSLLLFFFIYFIFFRRCLRHVKSGDHAASSGVSVGESCCATDTPSHRQPGRREKMWPSLWWVRQKRRWKGSALRLRQPLWNRAKNRASQAYKVPLCACAVTAAPKTHCWTL